MKRTLALLLALLLSVSLFSLGAAAEEGTKGYKVYPFEAFITNSARLDMTPNGAYTLTKNDALSETSGFLSFAVTPLKGNVDYNALDFLYLYTGDSLTNFTVKAEFNGTLDGYFYPSVEVYNFSEETKPNSTVKIPYKQLLEAAGKWDPANKYLYVSIQFFHDNDAAKKLSFQSIWLGGDTISTTEDDSKGVEVFDFGEPTITGNITSKPLNNEAFPGCAEITKEEISQEGYILKDLPLGARSATPYAYVNLSQSPALTTTYFYFKNPDAIITHLRVRPEMAGSNVWLRLDLRDCKDGAVLLGADTLTLRSHISIISEPSATEAGPLSLGVYSGGEVFKLKSADEDKNPDQPGGNTGSNNQKPSSPATGYAVVPGALLLAGAAAVALAAARKKR